MLKCIFLLQYREEDDSAWVYYIGQKIPAEDSSFVMRQLKSNATYLIKLAAKNEYGMGDTKIVHGWTEGQGS